MKMLAVLAAMVATAGLFAVVVRAQDSTKDLTAAQIESVRSNCVTSQASLQRLRDSDLIARTIHGRSYNDLSILMKSFNSRVAFNGINAPELAAAPGSLDKIYREFYDHYTSYATSMSETLNVKCKSQPERFYALFLKVEQHRELLAKDIADIQKLILEYNTDVEGLRQQLESSAPSGVSE